MHVFEAFETEVVLAALEKKKVLLKFNTDRIGEESDSTYGIIWQRFLYDEFQYFFQSEIRFHPQILRS